MTDVDEQGRPLAPPDGDERAVLVGFLDFERATLAWKTDGLDTDQLRRTTAASTMTLGGILKHMSFVEDYWFSYRLHGERPQEEFDNRDWQAEPDWDWTSAADESADQLRERWQAYVERARAHTERALAADGLDTAAVRGKRDGGALRLRWILTHMIQEYARHNGHADLLREAIDGSTGE